MYFYENMLLPFLQIFTRIEIKFRKKNLIVTFGLLTRLMSFQNFEKN